MPFNRGLQTGAAFACADTLLMLNFGDFIRKHVVFEGFANPAGIIATPEVVHPCLIVHAFADLNEQHEVLSPEVEFPLRPEKIEAPFGRQFPFCIFTAMAPPLHLGRHCPYDEWSFTTAQ